MTGPRLALEPSLYRSLVECPCCGELNDIERASAIVVAECGGCGCSADLSLRWSRAADRWLVIEWSRPPEQMNVRGPDAAVYLTMLVPNEEEPM